VGSSENMGITFYLCIATFLIGFVKSGGAITLSFRNLLYLALILIQAITPLLVKLILLNYLDK
jgi:hypothetical protein